MMGTEHIPPADLTQEDVSHLNVLAICFKVMAGLMVCFSCFPVVHLFIGLTMMTGGFGTQSGTVGAVEGGLLGGLFAGVALFIIVLYLGLGWVAWEVASRLEARRGFQFVTVCAALTCLNMPLGTILGVFTLIVINRPTVKAVFYRNDGMAR